MNINEAAAYPSADEWTAMEEWEAVEARFQRAKQALLDTQQRHGDAAHEFLLARVQVRQMLETAFPGAEAAAGQSASKINRHQKLKRASPKRRLHVCDFVTDSIYCF